MVEPILSVRLRCPGSLLNFIALGRRHGVFWCLSTVKRFLVASVCILQTFHPLALLRVTHMPLAATIVANPYTHALVILPIYSSSRLQSSTAWLFHSILSRLLNAFIPHFLPPAHSSLFTLLPFHSLASGGRVFRRTEPAVFAVYQRAILSVTIIAFYYLCLAIFPRSLLTFLSVSCEMTDPSQNTPSSRMPGSMTSIQGPSHELQGLDR